MDSDFVEQAMARINALIAEAERVTKTVGLPEEAMVIVLSIIERFKQTATDTSEEAVLAHVQERVREARNLTEALGLPPEKVHIGLSVIHWYENNQSHSKEE